MKQCVYVPLKLNIFLKIDQILFSVTNLAGFGVSPYLKVYSEQDPIDLASFFPTFKHPINIYFNNLPLLYFLTLNH